MTSRQTTINFPSLHPSQRAVAEHPARFKVIAAGRRWGKTRLGSALVVADALKGGRAWWVAPSYKMAAVGWRLIRKLAGDIPGAEIKRVDRMVILPGGGEAQVRSADEPNSLRGDGLTLVVPDECAFMKQAAWEEALRPALSDRQGKAVFISTPSARNWFFLLYQRGLSDGKEWMSWHFPTSDNPYIPASEIEAARQSLPELIFEQEYLAVFLEGQGAVFRNINACMGATPTTPADHKGHYIVAGQDWGKQNDFTATSIGCADCRMELEIDRFNQIDYHFQWKRTEALFNKWNVTQGIIEMNSIGTPGFEALERAGLPVTAFDTTPQTKPPLIENLSLVLQQASFQFIDDPIWKGELEAYERKVSPITGRSQYSAPEGMHDDTCIARALMQHGITNDRWLIY